MRLDRFLAGAGLTRSQARKAALAGRVRVGGAVVKDPAAQVEENAEVSLDGHPTRPEGPLHIMLHKPAGVVTAREDARFETVFGLLPEMWCRKDLSAVGRLDRDVTGLLLLTTDGVLAHRLISPRWTVEKIYRAKVSGTLTPDCVQAMAAGVVLSDFTARPARLEIEESDTGLLTVTEGKFHQVKRMFEKVGCPVLTLTRLSVGGVALDPNLAPGQCRLLAPAEAARLYAITALEGDT